MSRLLTLWSCCLAFVAFSLPSSAATFPPVTSTTQVVYLVNNATITTYDVAQTSGIFTLVGNPLTIASARWVGTVASLPNDHFLYIEWNDANNVNHLSVYATDAQGVPELRPIQQLTPASLSQFEVDPDGKFAYALTSWIDQQGEMESAIRLFYINASTGKLTESKQIQAHYGPDYYYSASLFGLNSTGTKLYDTWSFSFDHESAANYSYHKVDPTTGKLQPDVKIFATSDYDSADVVSISDKLLSQTFNSCCGAWVNVFNNPPKRSNGNYVPVIHCTATMLNACVNSVDAVLDPASKNLFLLPLGSGDTVVAHIDLAGKQLIQTDSIPGFVDITFSSDLSLIYAESWNYQSNSTITSYLFDSSKGTVTQADQLSVPAQALFPAQRAK